MRVPEDSYTGAPIESFDDLLIDDGFYEVQLEEDGDVPMEDDDEILFVVADVINGAASLSEIASRLYDLADNLTELSEDGWEIVSDVVEGHATIVRFAVEAE